MAPFRNERSIASRTESTVAQRLQALVQSLVSTRSLQTSLPWSYNHWTSRQLPSSFSEKVENALTGEVGAMTFIDVLDQDKLVCEMANVDSHHSMH